MQQRLNLPALAAFLRTTPPAVVVADCTPAHSTDTPQTLAATRWLSLLAAVLGCDPDWLLSTGRITADDLTERGSISATARLIRSHGWQTPPPPTPKAPPAPLPSTSTATPSAHWLAARDGYLGHIMACQSCRAFKLRNPTHCADGARLRRAYDLAPNA